MLTQCVIAIGHTFWEVIILSVSIFRRSSSSPEISSQKLYFWSFELLKSYISMIFHSTKLLKCFKLLCCQIDSVNVKVRMFVRIKLLFAVQQCYNMILLITEFTSFKSHEKERKVPESWREERSGRFRPLRTWFGTLIFSESYICCLRLAYNHLHMIYILYAKIPQCRCSYLHSVLCSSS